MQQQERAGQRAEHGGGEQPEQQPPLAGQLAAVADRAGQVARHQAEGVGDRRGHRRQADGQQHREGDEGARADDGVDAAGGEPGGRDRDHLPPRHRGEGVTAARCEPAHRRPGQPAVSAPSSARRLVSQPGPELRDRGRGQVVEALQRGDADCEQEGLQLGGLHALRDGLQPQPTGHLHDRLDHRLVRGLGERPRHERLVDLDDVDGQAAQRGQRGVARAEVVQRDAYAQLDELVKGGRDGRGVQHRGLGDLDDQLAGASPESVSVSRTRSTKCGWASWGARR